MRLCKIVPCFLLAAGLHAFAQADGCEAAVSGLNRVKEQITPSISPSNEVGRERLEVMLDVLEKGTHLCKDDFPELWYYRKIVGQRLGTPAGAASAKYAEKVLARQDFSISYDPFTLPPSARPPANVPAPMPVASSNAATVQPAVQPIHSKWALVIGINEFQDKSIPALRFAAKDSTDFANYLRDPKGGHFDPSHVIHLVNGNATLSGIREGLGKLRASVQEDDLVVVYISSHGSPRDMDPAGVSYIITADTHPTPTEKLYASSLQMIDLVQTLQREIKARRVVLFLDTCYSGGAQGASPAQTGGSKAIGHVWDTAPPANAPSSAAYGAALNNFAVGYGRAVITASRANELSWESPALQNGYFTYFLLDALKKEGSASLERIFSMVQQNVSTQVQKERNAAQTPTSQFSDRGGAIVLTMAGVEK